MSKDHDTIEDEFYELVNMQPKEIEEFLDTEESKSVGADAGDGESKGRKSARRIVEIKRKNKADRTEADWEHMQKVTGYIKRHRAQPPKGDWTETDWRYSLMNWGHDPCRA